MQSNLSNEASDLGGISTENQVNRKPWIVGLISLAAFTILFIAVLTLFKERRSWQPQIGHRLPLARLSYCAPGQITPCILSFHLDLHQTMVIHLLTNDSSSDFHIKIRQGEDEHLYPCRKAQPYSVHLSCTGETMPAGEALQFFLISNQGNQTLAQGTFPIIGLALATPEVIPTPTTIPFLERMPR